jgi:hypothetical protein
MELLKLNEDELVFYDALANNELMTLLELIKDGLKEEDKNIISQLDFQKSDNEIISDTIQSGLLNFEHAEKDDKKNQ